MTECYDWYISDDPYVAPERKTFEKAVTEVLNHGQRQVFKLIYSELMLYCRQNDIHEHMGIDELLASKERIVRSMVRTYIQKRKLNLIPGSWFTLFEDLHKHLGLDCKAAYTFTQENLDIIVQEMGKSLATAYHLNNDPDVNPIMSKALYDRRWSAFAIGLQRPVLANYNLTGIGQIVQWFINNPYLRHDQGNRYMELMQNCEGKTMRAIRREIENAK